MVSEHLKAGNKPQVQSDAVGVIHKKCTHYNKSPMQKHSKDAPVCNCRPAYYAKKTSMDSVSVTLDCLQSIYCLYDVYRRQKWQSYYF